MLCLGLRFTAGRENQFLPKGGRPLAKQKRSRGRGPLLSACVLGKADEMVRKYPRGASSLREQDGTGGGSHLHSVITCNGSPKERGQHRGPGGKPKEITKKKTMHTTRLENQLDGGKKGSLEEEKRSRTGKKGC